MRTAITCSFRKVLNSSGADSFFESAHARSYVKILMCLISMYLWEIMQLWNEWKCCLVGWANRLVCSSDISHPVIFYKSLLKLQVSCSPCCFRLLVLLLTFWKRALYISFGFKIPIDCSCFRRIRSENQVTFRKPNIKSNSSYSISDKDKLILGISVFEIMSKPGGIFLVDAVNTLEKLL